MLMFTSFAALLAMAAAHPHQHHGGHQANAVVGSVIPLAVQSVHHVSYKDVASGAQINPISVEIPANAVPINMIFRSASSQLNVQQAHQGAGGSVQESNSEDEPHVLRHTVTKPVIQEVKEVITPVRKIFQEIQPVREEINTVVARGTHHTVTPGATAHTTGFNFGTHGHH